MNFSTAGEIPTEKVLTFDHRVPCSWQGDILFVLERQLILFFSHLVHNEIVVVMLKLTLVYLSICQLLLSETGLCLWSLWEQIQSHYYTYYTSMKAQTKNIHQIKLIMSGMLWHSEVMVCSMLSHNSVVCVNKRGGKGGWWAFSGSVNGSSQWITTSH